MIALHFANLRLGRRDPYGSPLDEQLEALERVVSHAVERRAAAVIVAGGLLDPGMGPGVAERLEPLLSRLRAARVALAVAPAEDELLGPGGAALARLAAAGRLRLVGGSTGERGLISIGDELQLVGLGESRDLERALAELEPTQVARARIVGVVTGELSELSVALPDALAYLACGGASEPRRFAERARDPGPLVDATQTAPGCLELTLSDGKPKVKAVPSGARARRELELDVSGARSFEDLLSRLRRVAGGRRGLADARLKLRLVGRLDPGLATENAGRRLAERLGRSLAAPVAIEWGVDLAVAPGLWLPPGCGRAELERALLKDLLTGQGAAGQEGARLARLAADVLAELGDPAREAQARRHSLAQRISDWVDVAGPDGSGT